MSILDQLTNAVEHAKKDTPAYDVLMFMILKAVELGPGNDGLLFTYMREAREALDEVMQAVESADKETPVRSHNESQLAAYQLIQPEGLGMSGFAERLPFRPAWQEVVELLRLGKDEEARAKAEGIQAQYKSK